MALLINESVAAPSLITLILMHMIHKAELEFGISIGACAINTSYVRIAGIGAAACTSGYCSYSESDFGKGNASLCSLRFEEVCSK